MKNTFASPCQQGHFGNQVLVEYLRPQALVLPHEGASDTEKLPYLGVMLAPTPVLEFYGRCATRDPPCHKNDAVFYWWQDAHKSRNDIFVSENLWGDLVGWQDTHRRRNDIFCQNLLGRSCWIHGFHLSSGRGPSLHDRWPPLA